MKTARRRAYGWMALSAAGLAMSFSPVSGIDPDTADGGIVEPVVKSRPKTDVPHADAPLTVALQKLKRTPGEEKVTDVFAGRSWAPPAPPPAPVRHAPVVAAPVPTAPPLPFVYIGRMETDDAKPVIYLGRDDQLVTVTEGDTIDDTYRVESMSGTEITIVYLPLNVRQGLRIPGER